MHLIDTHVHINDACTPEKFLPFQSDLTAVRVRWQDAGVSRLVHSCSHPSEFSGLQQLADRFPEIVFAIGLHPCSVEDQWTPALGEQILHLAQSDSRVVAIGETGFDFYWSQARSPQADAFRTQLAIARQLGKPVIIHCRDAAQEMAEFLRTIWEEEGAVPGVMHCWGGTPEETEWFLELGLYISFSGTVTFKKATQIHESVSKVPGDRLLIETDCPFLSPTPKRGQRNEPAYVRYVAQKVADLRGISLETLAQQTSLNACHLFNLTLPNVSETLPEPLSALSY